MVSDLKMNAMECDFKFKDYCGIEFEHECGAGSVPLREQKKTTEQSLQNQDFS